MSLDVTTTKLLTQRQREVQLARARSLHFAPPSRQPREGHAPWFKISTGSINKNGVTLSRKKLFATHMDEQLDIDAEVLFRFVGHKFDNNPMAPVLFKDVITASDRSDGHSFGFFPGEKSHAYWFHGFQFTCNRDGKIALVPPLPPIFITAICSSLMRFRAALFIQCKCPICQRCRTKCVQRQAPSRIALGHDAFGCAGGLPKTQNGGQAHQHRDVS